MLRARGRRRVRRERRAVPEQRVRVCAPVGALLPGREVITNGHKGALLSRREVNSNCHHMGALLPGAR